MAKILRHFECDRCHQSTVAGVKEGIAQGCIWMGFPHRIYSSFTECGEIPAIVDLCPDCRASLIAWWSCST